MFGYIRPFKPELKIRDYEAYQAVYCGLCGQLGRSFGPFARLTLSYDFTFLCMLREALTPGPCSFGLRRCYVNPLKKVPACNSCESLSLSADVAAVVIYHKLRDNIADSALPGRIGWSLLRPFAYPAYRKAAKARPEAEGIVCGWMERQRELEAERNPNVDEACEPTAEAMSSLFRLLSGEEDAQRILARMGYCMGRFIYLCDALDDLGRDAKTGNYNPFLLRYKLMSPDAGELEKVRRNARDSLYLSIAEAAKAYALLETHQFGPVLSNIMELGLRASVETILSKAGGNRQ